MLNYKYKAPFQTVKWYIVPLNNMNLFETPIKSKKVRKGITAYQYKNGTVNINGNKYAMYSLSEAIGKYRKDFPSYR